jgi:hypothetical protein
MEAEILVINVLGGDPKCVKILLMQRVAARTSYVSREASVYDLKSFYSFSSCLQIS